MIQHYWIQEIEAERAEIAHLLCPCDRAHEEHAQVLECTRRLPKINVAPPPEVVVSNSSSDEQSELLGRANIIMSTTTGTDDDENQQEESTTSIWTVPNKTEQEIMRDGLQVDINMKAVLHSQVRLKKKRPIFFGSNYIDAWLKGWKRMGNHIIMAHLLLFLFHRNHCIANSSRLCSIIATCLCFSRSWVGWGALRRTFWA